MSFIIRIAFIITFFFTLSGKILAVPVLDGEDIDIVVEPEDYDAVEDEQTHIPPYLWKRAGFWLSHPSDFAPMRRPTSAGQTTRGSKKAENNPYHPVPRSVSQNQKNLRSLPTVTNDDLEAMIDDLRNKRQSPGSFLLMKLSRMNNKSGGDVNRRLGRRRA